MEIRKRSCRGIQQVSSIFCQKMYPADDERKLSFCLGKKYNTGWVIECTVQLSSSACVCSSKQSCPVTINTKFALINVLA